MSDPNWRDLVGDDGELITPLPTARKRKHKRGLQDARLHLTGRQIAILIAVVAGMALVIDSRAKSPSVPRPAAYTIEYPPNLLANGLLEEDSFELIASASDTNVVLHHWYLVLKPGASTDQLWVSWTSLRDDEHGHVLKMVDKKHCLSGCATSAFQVVRANGMTCYELTADVKTQVSDGANLILYFLDGNLRQLQTLSASATTDQWEKLSITALSPVQTRYLRVTLYTSESGQGITYWDQVHLMALNRFPSRCEETAATPYEP
jgi:hypothetical protein